MRNLKINPLWIAFLTVWVPGTIARFKIPETPKTILIWAVLIFQIYCLYLGIQRLKKKKN
ncbi:MAG: hypothetical protein GXY91_09245 [Clostridia bacterium]|nr:hypothetical protein [Clostridia bacterium]